jgi:predicted chitinase
MATLKDTIDSMKESNFKQFASDQEKRTREIMNSVDKYQKQVSGENQAYMDAIKNAVEKSAELSAGNLKDGVKGLKDIENVIKAQKDMAEADRQVLLKASDIAKMQMEAKSQSGILSKMKETISNNAIDITSVAAGLSGNSPAVMFATKYVLDKRKQMKEEKAARKKAMAEESLERLESIAAAKQSNQNAKTEAKVLQNSASGSAGAGEGSSSELLVWNELQAEELEKIRIGINSFLNNDIISSRNDEENRRENNRQTEQLIDAVEGIEVTGGVAGGDGKKGGGMLSGIMETLAGVLGANGLTGIMKSVGGLFAKAGPLAATVGRLATAAAPLAAVAVGGAMIAKDVYDMASAALDDDITTEIEGKDMGGVIGGALLGTVGMFVAGPLGAGLGMALGNMVGSFVGDTIAPNYSEVLTETEAQIQASKEALSASLSTITDLYNQGAITEAEYNEQRRVIEAQQALNANHEAMAAETATLQETMMAKGQQYNELNATIQSMEDQGLEVSKAMYDTLDTLEQEYDASRDAFENSAAELRSNVDPTWYDNLSAGLYESWNMLSGAASAGFETMKAGFESARGWFAEKITALDEAFGISEGVANAVEYVEAKASELAGKVADTVAETAAQVDAAITDTLAGVGLDDEYEAVRDAVGDAAGAAADMAGEVATVVGDAATAMTDAVDLSDGLDLGDVGNALGAGGEVLGEAIAPAIERAGEFVEAGQEAVSDAVDAGIAAMGLEDEVAFVEEQLDAAGEAVSEVGEAISDSIGGMVDGVSSWFGSWWGGEAADGAAAAMPNLRAGNPHTEINVDSGDAATRRNALERQIAAAGIDDPATRAAIMSQAHHETGGFQSSEENFNYSGKRLFELYGTGNKYKNKVRFNSVEEANALVSQGKSAVGDVIYGGRMGNTDAGDGFKYRGRGAFQLTGRENYKRYGDMVGVDLESNPELVNDPEIGAKVAVAYYQDRVSGRGIDSNNVDAVSKAINGGTVGLQDRRDLFASYMMQPGQGTSGTMLADAQAETDAALAAQQAALAGGGGAAVVNAPTTIANNSTSVTSGMGSSTQLMTPEEAQMMGLS